MTTLLKVMGFTLGGLAALVLATALYVWVSFDAHRTQSELTRYLAENYQRTLHIEGGISLRLWPRPELRLGDVSLSEPRSDAAFVVLKQARLQLALRPLLMQQIIVSRITVHGGAFALARDQGGTWNFADMLKPDDNKILPLDSFRLEGLELNDVALSLHDATGEAPSLELQGLQLSSGPLHAGGIGLIHAQAKLTVTNPVVDGDIRFDTHYQLTTSAAGRSNDMTMHFKGRAAALTDGESTFRINALTWTDQGAAWQLDKAQLAMNAALGKRSVEASAELPALTWAKDAPHGDLFRARLSVRDAGQSVTVQTEARGITAATGGFVASHMQTKWQVHNGAFGADAELSSPLRVDWHSGRVDWERITGELQLSHPRLNTANARGAIDGAVSWQVATNEKDATGKVKLAARFGTDDLRLAAQVSSLAPLSAHFDVSGESFNIDRLLVPATASNAAGVLPIGWLADTTLDGRLSFGTLKLGGLKLADVSAPITVQDGKFKSSAHSISLYGGTLKGNLAFSDNDKRMTWQETFQNVDLQAASQDAGQNFLFTGRASGSMDLAAEGADTAALTHSASGMVRLKLAQPSSLYGIDIGQSLREFRNAVHAGQATARTPHRKEQTELAEISGNIGIGEGKLFTRSLVAHNGWLRLAFDGEFDMQQKTFDLATRAVVSNLLPKTPANDLAELRGKPVPLRIKGTLAQLELQLEAPVTPTKSPTPKLSTTTKPAVAIKTAVPAQTVAKAGVVTKTQAKAVR